MIPTAVGIQCHKSHASLSVPTERPCKEAMEIRVITPSSSHLCSPPPPFTPLNLTQSLYFLVAKPSPFLTSRAPTTALSLSATTRRHRARARSRANGFSGARITAVKLESSLVVKEKATEIFNDLKGTSIFLVGTNCNVKTNLGMLLADALKYYYFDSDSLVEQALVGDSGAGSFREKNEKAFSDSETEVLKQLSSMGRLIICAGDGAVQSSTNLAYLRYGISVWIDVPLDLLANEILKTEDSLAANEATPDSHSFSEVLEELAKRYDKMKGRYGTADATVSLQKVATKLGYEDVDSVTIEDMALEALSAIEKLTRVKKMMEAAARPF